ncbi:MAG TPA: hypothetical protein VFI34_03060 [Candidatus Limnocylindrales bacterium]|nr:hypothetical protein [Candidatus Limnocylindrales bacterium]
MSDPGDALGHLPSDARLRLDAFARALERVHLDDLPLYMARRRQPRHRRAVETAALTTRELGLEEPLDAARAAVRAYVLRAYADAAFRPTIAGFAGTGPVANPEERLAILRSLDEAVSALVLGDRLDADIRGELLGLWDRLLP